MRKLTLSILLCCFSCVGMAQVVNPQLRDSIFLRVTYQMMHIDDSNHRDQPIEDELYLYIGKHSSMFRRKASEMYALQEAKQKGQVSDLSNVIDDYSGLIHDFTTQAMQSHEVLIQSHFIVDFTAPQIEWTLANDEREILGYISQKAIAKFGGRTYTAWFAKDIPISAGPYKFSGLPGLILDISDDRGEITYRAIEIENSPQSIFHLRLANGHKKVGLGEFKRVEKLFREDPSGFIKAQGLTNVRIGSAVGKPRKVFNNPIEKN